MKVDSKALLLGVLTGYVVSVVLREKNAIHRIVPKLTYIPNSNLVLDMNKGVDVRKVFELVEGYKTVSKNIFLKNLPLTPRKKKVVVLNAKLLPDELLMQLHELSLEAAKLNLQLEICRDNNSSTLVNDKI